MSWKWFDTHLSTLADFFAPTTCMMCQRLQQDTTVDICQECRTAASVFMHYPWKIPHVKKWTALWQYAGNVRQAMIRYKFFHRRGYGDIMGRELAKKLEKDKNSWDVITWVPISFFRRLGRGYDQVELITERVAADLGKQKVKTLRKLRNNRKQANIRGKKARKRNVEGVYRVTDPELVRGKRVLLIDDIVTTGATVSEAAKMLKEAGAKEVQVACVASAVTAVFRPD